MSTRRSPFHTRASAPPPHADPHETATREATHRRLAERYAASKNARLLAQAIAERLPADEAHAWAERLPPAPPAPNGEHHFVVLALCDPQGPLAEGVDAPALAELCRGLRAHFAPHLHTRGPSDAAPDPQWRLAAHQRWYAWAARCAERAANETSHYDRAPRRRAYRAGQIVARLAAKSAPHGHTLTWDRRNARTWGHRKVCAQDYGKGLCCKPDEGARCCRQDHVLDLCFRTSQVVL